MGKSRYVVALGDFIIEAPISERQARALLSLLRVLYVDYLGAYRNYRGVVINVGKFVRRLALRIAEEFGIKYFESSSFHVPCLIIYYVGLDIPPMIFRVSSDASFEDVLREVLRRGFINVVSDLHVEVTYVYREGGRLRVDDDYFKVVVNGPDDVYIEYRDPGEEYEE
ncbi:hypothetical protein VMUT_2276 [Vulcanisaeta moutnovskia 768-28]|uniref:Uncharacterized protein n=1 Tax=Vulcanisaeta moutnovskia (strain 768-28) TaxID=985053 RepID=F0QXY5_VULM7|nr:hypothetical protein [Vulcanisaeta moutnovskia]ADY02471.1 hypothetical protein VMUT_2276 [Vulcanisaeta moutnovskia 768-28]